MSDSVKTKYAQWWSSRRTQANARGRLRSPIRIRPCLTTLLSLLYNDCRFEKSPKTEPMVNIRSLSLGLLGLATFGRADLLDTILKDLESAVDCDSCQNLLVPIQTLAHQGDIAFATTFATICKTLGVSASP